MLPIFEACSKNYFSVTTDTGKKRFMKKITFRLDTGDVARKAGRKISDAASDGARATGKFLRHKYRDMKIERKLRNLRKSAIDALKIEVPYRILKSRLRRFVSA